jgi:hypothetical protein
MARALAFAVALVASMFGTTTPAAACSVGPAFDPRLATDVFIVGRVVAVRVVGAAGVKTAPQLPVAYVTVDVVSVLKGRAPARVTLTDQGAGDGCSALAGDPASYIGRYAALALKISTSADGTTELSSNRLYGAAFGSTPGDEAIRALIARHQLRLPATSTGRATSYLAAAPFAALAALAGLMFMRRRSDRAASRGAATPRANTAR